jgi:hypothetical protein
MFLNLFVHIGIRERKERPIKAKSRGGFRI